jgi:Xaa-Pro dipeptidase
MAIHFEPAEFAARQVAVTARLNERGLDGLLMFRQESMYYLTGYDTFGYVYFQCLVLGADGRLTLLTRLPDKRQAEMTSVIPDIRIWADREGATPAAILRDLLAEQGFAGKRLGVEYEAYGLTARSGLQLAAALDGFCVLTDESNLVSEFRLVKSPAELVYVRRAAELADLALDKANAMAVPGADEGHILAAMQGAIFEGGGDYPGNEFIIGSGPEALLVRYHAGRRKLEPQDQLTVEFAGTYRHYHACLMRTIRIGAVPQRAREMHKVAVDAMAACLETLRPGRTMGEVFDAHARVMDAGGMAGHRMNACGYSMGTTFSPNWMDWPMFFTGNPVVIQPGMVFFLHMITLDVDAGLAMMPGQTALVTDSGCEVLSRRSLDLVAN